MIERMKTMRYGVPYQGSKNKICERLFVQERFFKKYNELMSEGKLF